MSYSRITRSAVHAFLTSAFVFAAVGAATAQTKVMPLGDSNTRGKDGFHYRSSLRDRFINEAGHSINYVGSGTSVAGAHGPGPDANIPYSGSQITALGGDLEHEGWGGYTIDGIAGLVNGALASRNPDTVLLMIGTNDFADGIGEGAIERLDNLVAQIFSQKPNVTLLVGSIAPTSRGFAALNRAVQDFNRDLPGMVNDYFGEGRKIYFANTGGLIDPELDMVDSLHMTAAGYRKIGDGWFEVLKQLTAGNAQPQVTFTVNGPQNEGYFLEGADLNLSALAFDSDGTIDRVVFHADGEVLGTTTGEPHMFVWSAAPRGKYEITATVYDNLGFPGYSYPLTIQVGEPKPKAALVVGSGGFTSLSDQKISDSIELLGFEVEMINALVAGASGVGDADFIVISSSVSSGQLGAKFRDSPVPVIVCEPFLFDDMSLTGGVQGLDYEQGFNQTQVVVSAAAHPLAAGLVGTVSVVSDGSGFLSWGRPGGQVLGIGHLVGNPGRSAIMAIEKGGLLVNGNPAAERRVGLFLGDNTAENFTASGQALLDAAISWTTEGIASGGGPGGGVNGAPNTGILGGDQFVEASAPAAINLDAFVVDDGKPVGNPVAVQWSSSSGDVSFSPSDSPSTQVTINAFGEHPVTITVSDGELSSSDTIVLTLIDPAGKPVNLTYSENPAIYQVGAPITPNLPGSLGGDVVSYSVSPALPVGLDLDPVTGIISGTPLGTSAATNYQVTATNGIGSASRDLTITVVTPPPSVLLVVGSIALNSGDGAVRDWFSSRGSVVTLKSFAEVQSSDATGVDLVLITSTGSSGQLGSKLRDVTVPVVVCEPYVYDDMGLTANGSSSSLGTSSNETHLQFTAPSHPLGAGLSGLTGVVTSGSGFFTWGVPGTAAVRAANLVGNSSHAAIFGYDIGDPLANGLTAPHRRVGFFLGDLSASNLTGQGAQAVAAAIRWALEGGGIDPNGPPVQLNYSQNPASYTQGEEIVANTPSSSGSAPTSYSITPGLPLGLGLDTLTGEISGTPVELAAPEIYQITALNSLGSTVAELVISVDPPPLGRVLLVVGNTQLNSGDLALSNWIQARNYLVTVRSFSEVQIGDANGMDLVLITATGSSGAIGGKLRDVPVPMIVCESFIFDDLGLTALVSGFDFGAVESESQIRIVSPGHSLAAGLTGLVDLVTNTSGFFSFGRAGGEAIEIAVLGSDSGRSAIFAYDTGSLLASGVPALNRRLGLCFGDLTAANLTGEGLQILEAAFQWALEGGSFDPNGPPVQLSYQDDPAIYDVDVAINPNSPLSFGGAVEGYTILPTLPAGLTLDPLTGVISGIPTEAISKTTYTVTATNPSGATTADLEITVMGPPIGDVLMVVGNTSLNSGDDALKSWFQAANYRVTLQSFADVLVEDAAGKDLVIITATGISSDIEGRLSGVPVPVIVCESFIFDDMGLTQAGDGVELGSLNSQTQIQILRPEHPLAAGLSGVETMVANDAGYFTWGVVAGEGLNIASLTTNASHSAIFAYESGAMLASGQPAAHRRLGLFLGDFTAANFTAKGSRIFAAAVQWAINGTGFDVNGPPLQLTYSSTPVVYNLNVPIIPNTPSSLGGAVAGYSITPALPAGLTFDPITGIISGTPAELRSPSTHEVIASNATGSASTTLNLSVVGGSLPKALLVVGSSTLNSGDAAIRNWFVSAGYNVTLRTLTAVQASDTVGQDLVMITSTGGAGQIGNRLSDAPVPIIVSEPFAYGNMGMTLAVDNVNMGFAPAQDRLDLVNPGHPLSAGLSGLTTVVSSNAGFFPWGVPGDEAVTIATLESDPSRSSLFAYESGTLLASGLPAPNRRVGMFLGDLTAANFTAAGQQLFAATVQWAYEGRTYDENGAPARLRYSKNRAVYPPGVAITPNIPTSLGGAVEGYAISPALPAGLEFDPVTGIISGTPTEIREESGYLVTAYNPIGVTTATLTLAVPGPPDVLLVVGNLTLNPGDTALRNWFQTAGYGVTLRTFAAVQAADAFGKELVMISATGSASQIGTRLKDVAAPVIVCESAIYDDMGLTTAGDGVKMGNVTSQSQIQIINAGHPLAAGLSGLTNVISGSGQMFTWGVPAGDAVTVATLASDSSRSALFAYEKGSLLASGQAAPHRRLGLFLGDATPSKLSTQGRQILAASVEWALYGLAENALPSELSYSTDPAVYQLDVPITPNLPSFNGGTPGHYLISPLLPAGLVLNPVTGVISGTPTVASMATRYQVTASNPSGSSSVAFTLTVEGRGDVLLVVGSLNLNTGDKAVRDWFVARGYEVSALTLAEVQAADTVGKDLVLITSTGSSSQIGSRLRDVAVPVIVCEPYIFGNMGMTLPGNDVQMGNAPGESQLALIASGHPLAAGLDGLTTVVGSSAGFFPWGVPGVEALTIATLVSHASRSPLFAYEIGSLMASGQPAPSRRLAMFFGDFTAANLTTEGSQLFAAGVDWALEEPEFDENGPPVALSYATNPAVYGLDLQIAPNLPSSLGGTVTSYSILPPLPPGLVLNPATGVISGKPRASRPPTTYQVTATNAAGSTSYGLSLSVQGPPPGDVLLVVGNLTLNAGDRAIRDWFVAGGYGVTLRTLAAVQVEDTANKVLVMITSTGSSGQIGSRLRDVAVPVIVSEPYLFGSMGMTLPGNDVQMGNAPGETQINLLASEHPVTVGLSGVTTVATSGAGFFAWGKPGGEGLALATLASDSSRSTLFAYESGAQLAAGDAAPHRRLGMFMGDLTASNFTLPGWWIFAAGVQWAIKVIVIDEGPPVDPPVDPPNPPTALTYSSNTAIYESGSAITPNTPSSQGGGVGSYAITPDLPAGLAFDTMTGIISGTPTEIRSVAAYQVTATNQDGFTSATLTISVTGPAKVLLVVGSLSLNSGDTALRNWFQSAGYAVTLRTFAAAQAADAADKGLVFISATGSSGQLGARLSGVQVPVIVCESYLFDDMGLTAFGNDVEFGNLNAQTQIQITGTGHPLAVGLSGLTTVVGNSGSFGWGIPGGGAVNIATLASNPAHSALFAYDAGSLLASGQIATHRRVGLFFGDFTAGSLNSNGTQLLAASVQWARGLP